ncbi:MAG: biotin--[acetyl-CoA-carboxylase] ligase [Cellulomonas sp.]|nr:biotin--[acetyl-CoA-carboxylase] ligase [Cellulomonas sp.]
MRRRDDDRVDAAPLPADAEPADALSAEALPADALRRRLVAPAGPLPRLVVVDRTGSTNDDVLAGLRDDPDAWPTGALLLADHQTAGHGRQGRTWVSAPRTSLTGTFVVRPVPGSGGLGWLPLVVGLGLVRALRAAAGVQAWLKWPNDVLVDQPGERGPAARRKVAGILAQTTPDGAAVAVGVGLNVTQRADQLPVPTATSLALTGDLHRPETGSPSICTDRSELLVATVTALAEVVGRWCAGGAGLADEVAQVCPTLGSQVRVDLPGGAALVGRAVRLADDGALVVVDPGGEHTVRAGDVVHLVT